MALKLANLEPITSATVAALIRRPNGSKSPLYCSLDLKLGREAE